MSVSAAVRPLAERSVPPASSIRGRLRIPGDKSISHRAALFNAIADGHATITNFSPGADCASTLGCLRARTASTQSSRWTRSPSGLS